MLLQPYANGEGLDCYASYADSVLVGLDFADMIYEFLSEALRSTICAVTLSSWALVECSASALLSD